MHTNSGQRVFHAIMHRRCKSRRSSHSSLPEAVRFHECDTLRYGQAPSGALRYSLKRSASILVQPSSSAMTATTASRATDTLHCFNGLQQPQRPSRPQAPEEPQRPQGWMLSFDSPPPIPQLSVKNSSRFLVFSWMPIETFYNVVAKPIA